MRPAITTVLYVISTTVEGTYILGGIIYIGTVLLCKGMYEQCDASLQGKTRRDA